MKIGVPIRLMGPQATRETVCQCALAAEAAGFDDLWVPDHIAIPPDDAEGSGGRYLDPLTCLAWLAAATSRIGLGTGVLVVPYRPPLPTAKAIATVPCISLSMTLRAAARCKPFTFKALRCQICKSIPNTNLDTVC